MKTIEDVIKKDTKWLIHFLKENHIFKQYFEKWCGYQPNIDNDINYNNFLNHIQNNKEYYQPSYLTYSNLKTSLFDTCQLLNNIMLFCDWQKEPFVFSRDYVIESYKWSEYTKNYKKLKNSLKSINYENY